MTVPLIVHVSAATLALVSGYISLGVGKGGVLHKRSGLVFMYSMVVMGLFGTGIAIYRVLEGSTKPALHGTVLMGVFVAYLVVTALTVVRPPGVWSQRLERIGTPIALVIGLTHFTFAVLAARSGNYNGLSWPFYTIFGSVALLAVRGDLRILRNGPLTGAKRITRHLWRMCTALLVAALSFFLGQGRFIPPALRSIPVRLAPVLVVLAVMLYWVWRVRFRKSLRNLVLTSFSPASSRDLASGRAPSTTASAVQPGVPAT